jgi:RIO kinase 2
MRLDPNQFRYLLKDDFRLLMAVEMGHRNHELVPMQLIESIAKMQRGKAYKVMQQLLKHKLVHHAGPLGYKLTYLGYDYLALRTFVARGVIKGVGRRIGVGKESDIHFAEGPDGEVLALKLHRLGRISFRSIKKNRDYLQHRTHASWMYMARLAAAKEFAYMKALRDEGFPVPVGIDHNRHAVLMQFIYSTPMYHVKHFNNMEKVVERLMRLIVRLARAGIIHGDFNEFNLMIDKDDGITVIDFPQVVYTSHPNAEYYFNRDVRCIVDWFRKHQKFEVVDYPKFSDVVQDNKISVEVKGLGKAQDALLLEMHCGENQEGGASGSDSEAGDDEDDPAQETVDAVACPGQESFQSVVPVDAEGEADLAEELDEEATLSKAADDAIETDENKKSGGYAKDRDLPPALSREDEPEDDKENAENEDDEDDDDSDDGEAEEKQPNKINLKPNAKVRKTRQAATAESARKNLQKQKKKAPAKSNDQKNRSMRSMKSEAREGMSSGYF